MPGHDGVLFQPPVALCLDYLLHLRQPLGLALFTAEHLLPLRKITSLTLSPLISPRSRGLLLPGLAGRSSHETVFSLSSWVSLFHLLHWVAWMQHLLVRDLANASVTTGSEQEKILRGSRACPSSFRFSGRGTADMSVNVNIFTIGG